MCQKSVCFLTDKKKRINCCNLFSKPKYVSRLSASVFKYYQYLIFVDTDMASTDIFSGRRNDFQSNFAII